MFPNLATLNALNFAAAWSSANSNIVYFISSAPGQLEPFLNRIQITPCMKYIDLSGCTTNSDVHSLLEPGAQGSLILIETSKDYFIYLRDLLQIPELNQVIVLQLSCMGRMLLPEWEMSKQSKLLSMSAIQEHLEDWRFEKRSIGNLRSLLWGFLSGKMLTLNRLDLMDRCLARMRRHLFPSNQFTPFPYIRILRWVRTNTNR